MAPSLTRTVALVTGAGSGIGRAVAVAFGRSGARVAAADIDGDGAEATARLVRADGADAFALEADVSSSAQVQHMVEEVVARYERLDVACNNAGVEGAQAFTAECTEANWDRVMGINLRGVWLCMKYEVPQMQRAGGGAIVNIASIAGLVGFPGIPAYVASKHGINGLTKTAALEYAADGIRVNAVCPGAIQTPMIDRFVDTADRRAQLEAQHPVGRFGTPEEIAAAVVWLCSESASFVTGHIMAVDGGYTAR